MGNILRFPDRCDTVSCREFLQDGDDTLHFESAGESRQDQKYTFPQPKNVAWTVPHEFTAKDWSNQELAHLYRVKRLLDLAGVSNSIDRGLSDEGDPWFVFCDATDEVFIHLCRIDGVYFLDNPSIEKPLRGGDFTQLVEAFVQKKLRSQEQTSVKGKHQLVRFERNGKVFLHPATMLAALVWTLLLESDDLVMVLQKDAEKLDQGDSLTTASSDFSEDAPFEIQNLWQASLDLEKEGQGRSSADSIASSHHFRDMDPANDYKFGQNPYIVGLSAVAISLGIMSERSPVGIEKLTVENILDLLSILVSQTVQSSDISSNFEPDADEALGLITILENLFVDAVMTADRTTEDPTSIGHVSAKVLAQNADLISSGHVLTEVEPGVREANSETSAHTKEPGTQVATFLDIKKDQTLISSDSSTSQENSVHSDVAQFSLMLSRLESVDKGGSFSAMSLRSYTIDSNTLYATFDISDADFDKTSSLLGNSTSQTYSPIDDTLPNDKVSFLPSRYEANQKAIEEAYKFVSYLLDKEGDLEIIALDKELIFVDPDVFGAGSSDTYVMSWKMNDGETISVIGLQDNYADFYLLA